MYWSHQFKKIFIAISFILWFILLVFEVKVNVIRKLKSYELSLLDIVRETEQKIQRLEDVLVYARNIFIETDDIVHHQENVLKDFSYDQKSKTGFSSVDLQSKGVVTFKGALFTKLNQEIIARSFLLEKIFSPAYKNFKNIPWFYLTTENMLYLYPWISPQDFFYDEIKIGQKEFFQKTRPQNNPERKFILTNPYLDEAGKGPMFTASLPIYLHDQFVGSLSADILLRDFSKFQEILSDHKKTELLILNKDGFKIAPFNDGQNDNQLDQYSLELIYRIDQFYYFNHFSLSHFLFDFVHEAYFKISGLSYPLDYYIKIDRLTFFIELFLNLRISILFFFILLFMFVFHFLYSSFNLEKEKDKVYRNKLLSLAEMSAGIAHEINNPLTVIKGRSELALKKINSEDELDREYLKNSFEKVHVSVERISKIIRALKSFSREGTLDPMIPVALKTIIDDSLLLSESKLKSHNVKLNVEDPPQVLVHCRAFQIVQIFINLINNSIDAMEVIEEDRRELSIKFIIVENSLEVYVSDAGFGIPNSIVQRMFDPFYTSKEVDKGTGLGLSISKKIALEHGGDLIYAKDKVHTTFVLKLICSKDL